MGFYLTNNDILIRYRNVAIRIEESNNDISIISLDIQLPENNNINEHEDQQILTPEETAQTYHDHLCIKC